MGGHPTVDEGIVGRKVVFGYIYNSYYQRIYIKVRNCGHFYVYKLKPSPGSGDTRYCTEYQ